MLISITSNVWANDLWTRYQFVNLDMPTQQHVNSLHEDIRGQIWIGANSGVYRIQNNKIKKVSHAPSSAIKHIIGVPNGEIWLAGDEGVWRWDHTTNYFSVVPCFTGQAYRLVIQHPNLGILALSQSGVYQLSDDDTCQKMQINGLPENASIERLVTYQQKLIVAVRGHGLFQCSKSCNEVKTFSPALANTRVRELVVHQDTLYAGTHRNGFYAINVQGEILRHWHKEAESVTTDFSLPANGVMSLLLTDEKILAGLWAGGLQQFDLKSGSKLSSSRFYAADTTTVGGRHIRALLISQNDTLYVGHENGISIALPAYNQQDWIGLANEFYPGFSDNNNVVSLYYHKDAWIAGTSAGGLYRIGHTDNTLRRLASDEQPPLNLPTKSIWEIAPSLQGDLLLGTSKGVMRLNPDTLDWRQLDFPIELKGSDVYRLTEAPDQTVWVSLWEGGIARVNQNGQLLGHWSKNDGLVQKTSESIKSTADNEIFVLNTAGLFYYQNKQSKFAPAKLHEKSPQCHKINQITTDASKQLWALCEQNSLWRYHKKAWLNITLPTSEEINLLFPAKPDQSSDSTQLLLMSEQHVFGLDFEGNILWKEPRLLLDDDTFIQVPAVVKNKLTIATSNGLYRQDFSKSIVEIAQPEPIISGLRVFNKPLQIDTLTSDNTKQRAPNSKLYQGQLQLDYDQDLITFEFALPGYYHLPNAGFEYRLIPFHKKWLTTAEDETQASYTRLPPGHYEFEVKALDSPQSPTASFKLTILPPWYLTWWAKTLLVLLIIASLLAAIVSRTRRLEKRNLWLQKKVRARTIELEKANSQLQQVAYLDALTGLLNRRGFRQQCEPNWVRYQDNALLMIADIDHFKQFNDQYGHQLGDEVLLTCSQRLKSAAGPNDLIARWGGEEFLILLHDDPTTSINELQIRAQQLQKIIGETPMDLCIPNITVTLTAGVAIHSGESFETCLRQADQKLYDGKDAGRNRIIF